MGKLPSAALLALSTHRTRPIFAAPKEIHQRSPREGPDRPLDYCTPSCASRACKYTLPSRRQSRRPDWQQAASSVSPELSGLTSAKIALCADCILAVISG